MTILFTCTNSYQFPKDDGDAAVISRTYKCIKNMIRLNHLGYPNSNIDHQGPVDQRPMWLVVRWLLRPQQLNNITETQELNWLLWS